MYYDMDCNKDEKVSSYFPIHYTEDGLPVYTIYLSNIPRSTTEKELKEYFATFGEVTSVSTIHKNNSNNCIFRYGFVTFKEPESATKALHTRFHSVISTRMKVRPADSWKQPKLIKKEEESNDASNTDPNAISILNLNDDCLLHIMSFLRNSDKIKLSIVCTRFRDVYGIIIKIEKLLDLNDLNNNFTLMETRQVLSQIGVHIKRVRLHEMHEPNKLRRILEFVAMFCHYIEELDFEYVNRVHFGKYNRLLSCAKNLQNLKMINCEISDKICSVISSISTLQRLNLSENQDISGKYLRKLDNLLHLNLKNCENLEANHFIEICKSTKLKTLDIRGCYQLNDAAFKTLIKTQTNLESLIVSNLDYSWKDLAKLPSLKHLKINKIHNYVGSNFNSSFLQELAIHKKDTLESLELHGELIHLDMPNKEHICSLEKLKVLTLDYDRFVDDNFLRKIAKCLDLTDINIAGCINTTDDGISYLIEHTKNLKFLNISSCAQFKDASVFKWIKILRKKGLTEDGPFTIFIEDTKINPSILKHKKFKGNDDIIRLQFECRSNWRFKQALYWFLRDDEFSDDYDYINGLSYSSDDDYDIYDFVLLGAYDGL